MSALLTVVVLVGACVVGLMAYGAAWMSRMEAENRREAEARSRERLELMNDYQQLISTYVKLATLAEENKQALCQIRAELDKSVKSIENVDKREEWYKLLHLLPEAERERETMQDRAYSELWKRKRNIGPDDVERVRQSIRIHNPGALIGQ